MKSLSFLLLFIQSIIEYFVRVLFYFSVTWISKGIYIKHYSGELWKRARTKKSVPRVHLVIINKVVWLSWGQILFCKLTVTKMTLASVVTLYKHTWYTYLAIIDKKLESPGVKFSFGNWLIKAILTSVVTFYDLLFEFLMSRNVKNAEQSE